MAASRPGVRLAADRFRRIWSMVQHIANHPGLSRGEIAAAHFVSERQAQADLGIVRWDMQLPLTRRQGYRFVAEGSATIGTTGLTLADALLLFSELRHAIRHRPNERDRLVTLATRLAHVFPPHLAPLAAECASAIGERDGRRAQVFATVCEAVLTGAWVQLTISRGDVSVPASLGSAPVLRPETVFPLHGAWFVLGETETGRLQMLNLAAVAAIKAAEPYWQQGARAS